MEVQLGVGRVYPRPAGRTFRGVFKSFFQSVCDAYQPSQEELGVGQPPPSAPCLPSPWPPPDSPACLPPPPGCLPPPEPRAVGKALPAAGPAMGLSFPCAGELRELLDEAGAMPLLPPPETEPADKEDPVGDSARQLCRAVSASMGLALEGLETPAKPLPRGDCMFAVPAGPARAPRPSARDPSPAFEAALAAEPPTGPGLPRGFGRVKLESASGLATSSGWGGPCRFGAELVPPGPAPLWPTFFADEGQLYGPCPEPPADCPADAWYPPGRAPFAALAPGIKSELEPWVEGYAGAYGDLR
ncbi:hypothetical protein HGM15179_021215 [Zosterops borbonicus]|uniref:Androgen receptor n=1 Tax=Zosterops borbonicus TaxID=364589 RepID=A0A8K1D6A5_9PASS|nr:hypothetical protein HGM15179_021215 [Zosterops borbonicus]